MAALTADNVLQKKDVGNLFAFPVNSGETIYQNTLVGIGADGLLYDLDATIIKTALLVGIVADDSNGTTPAATTADGSLALDRSSAVAGDKTVRQVWTKGRFLLSFTSTLTQADVGKVAYAINNNDCKVESVGGIAIGTIVSFYSASLAWVDLNVLYNDGTITVKQAVAGSTSTAAGGLFTVANPFGAAAILESLVFEISTASTGAATADIGIDVSTSSDTLMDGLTLNGAVTGIYTPVVGAGTNGGKCPDAVGATENILATASASTAGLVGVVEAKFRRWL